jgi:hypothetical protein
MVKHVWNVLGASLWFAPMLIVLGVAALAVLFHDATGSREGDIERPVYSAQPNGAQWAASCAK